MQSTKCTHIPIAQTKPVLDEWDEAAAKLAQAFVPGNKRRNRERFGMSRELRSALTQFARIGRSRPAAQRFRRDYPNFFPAEFWNSWSQTPEVPNEQLRRPLPFWRVWLKLLEQAWKAGFHSDYVIQLNGVLLSDPIMCELPQESVPIDVSDTAQAAINKLVEGKVVSEDEWKECQDVIAKSRPTTVKLEPQIDVELPVPATIRCIEIQPVYDFQHAVAAMGASPWRAKFCSKCGQPFVADKPQRDYCSDACRKIIHRMAWQERWERYGKKWRKKQRTTNKAKRRS